MPGLEDPFGPAPVGQVEVLRGRSKRAVRNGALALQARGIGHMIQSGGSGVRITVAESEVAAALEELRAIQVEETTWDQPQPAPPPLRTSGVRGAVAFGLLILVLFPIGQLGAFDLNWWKEGLMSAGLVRDGEVWRTVTALTLHVDLQHLVGNLVFGGLFGLLAAQTLGTGLAWWCTLLAGAAGNLTESFLTPPDHTAVGASTAIFGTLGLMVTSEWTRRGQQRSPWVRRVAPLFGGAVLFGWLGVGDGSGRVDVLAHATGFAAGAVIGVVVARLQLARRTGPRAQAALVVATVALIALAWAAALST